MASSTWPSSTEGGAEKATIRNSCDGPTAMLGAGCRRKPLPTLPLSDETIVLIRGRLHRMQYVQAGASFDVARSRSHGAVEAVYTAF